MNRCVFYGVLAFICLVSLESLGQETVPARTAWFRHAGYGLFFHFLPTGPGFQKRINDFDVNAFAADCKATGAGYVIFTMGQNEGYYNAPNASYDAYTGHPAGERCSKRDLPMDLARALKLQGMRLMLYVSGDLPCNDSAAAQKLGGVTRLDNENGQNWVFNDTLVHRWGTVLRDWSMHYGKQVSGWWVDGCYRKSGFTDAYAHRLGAALKAGNADAIVCYNTGLNYDKVADEDYLAGEERNLLSPVCPGASVNGAQWHELSFLGADWGRGDPRFSASGLAGHIKAVKARGGVVSIDVRLEPNYSGFRINQKHLEVLKAMKALLDEQGI